MDTFDVLLTGALAFGAQTLDQITPTCEAWEGLSSALTITADLGRRGDVDAQDMAATERAAALFAATAQECRDVEASLQADAERARARELRNQGTR